MVIISHSAAGLKGFLAYTGLNELARATPQVQTGLSLQPEKSGLQEGAQLHFGLLSTLGFAQFSFQDFWQHREAPAPAQRRFAPRIQDCGMN